MTGMTMMGEGSIPYLPSISPIDSPTGVENIEEFLQRRQHTQNSSVRRLMAKDDDNEQRQSMLRKNADQIAGDREQRRLLAVEMMGENSSMVAMRQRLEQQLQEKQATAYARFSVLETIRRHREEDQVAAAEEMNRRARAQLEKKTSSSANVTSKAKLKASKYSGLSKGLGVADEKKPCTDTLKGFLTSEVVKENISRKYLRMSQSLSGLSHEDDEMEELSLATDSISRSDQRWQTRAEMSRVSDRSASILSGGHIVKKQQQKQEDDVSTTETDFDSVDSDDDDDDDAGKEEEPLKDESTKGEAMKDESMKDQSMKDQSMDDESMKDESMQAESMKDESMKDDSIRIVPDPAQTPVAAATTPSQSTKPRGILKRTSTIGFATTPAPLTTQSTHVCQTPTRSILHSLYDGGRTLSLQSIAVDNSTSHATRISPHTPKTLPSSSSRTPRSQRRSNSSRKLQDGSGRHENSNSNNDNQLSRSGSDRRMSSMSRAKSARRLQRGQSRRKGLGKTNSNRSRLSHNEDVGEGNVISKQSKRGSTPATTLSPKKTESSSKSKPSSEYKSKRSSAAASEQRDQLTISSTRENPRKESRGSSGDNKSRRPRSRSRTRSSAKQERNRKASRSRTRRPNKQRSQTDLPAAAEEKPRAKEPQMDNSNKRISSSRRRQKSERNLTKSRSERNVNRKAPTSKSSEEEMDTTLAKLNQPETDAGDNLVQFNPTFKHNVSIISPRPGDSRSAPPCDHKDLAVEDDHKSKRKGRRASLRLPIWGKKKAASSHQPMETSNSSLQL